MFVADAKGRSVAVPIDTMVIVVNRGGSRANVIEANITVKVIGNDGIESILNGKPLLPQFDRNTGLPMYEKSGRVVLKKCSIGAAERRNIKGAMPVPNDVADQVRGYLATHPDNHVEHLALLVFGYFRYRDLEGRSFTTGFCRRYDRPSQRFIVIDEPDYEYSD
jgi:hypothetical protein